MVVVPPRDTAPPPVSPVPAVMVRDELASSELSITPAGRDTSPELMVNPPEVMVRRPDRVEVAAVRVPWIVAEPVVVALVKTAVEGVAAPMGVLSIDPPEMVRLSAM